MVDWVLRMICLCIVCHLHYFSAHGSKYSIGKGLIIYSDCLAFCSLCTLILYIIPQNEF